MVIALPCVTPVHRLRYWTLLLLRAGARPWEHLWLVGAMRLTTLYLYARWRCPEGICSLLQRCIVRQMATSKRHFDVVFRDEHKATI